MKYSKILDLISNNIFQMDEVLSEKCSQLITDKTNKNFNIYRKNLLGLLIKTLTEYFPATQKYIGQNNFIFLIRDYIIKNGINSPSFIDCSQQFYSFLRDSFDVHQDDLLDPIARLDLFWSLQGESKSLQISLPKGTAIFWQSIIDEKDYSELTINLEEYEILALRKENNENVLVITV